jgi:hypothetical protein
MSPDQNLEPKNLIADAIDAAEDMPDPLAGLTAADRGAPLAQSADGPIPLFPRMPPAEPFPVEALGPSLSEAAAAIFAESASTARDGRTIGLGRSKLGCASACRRSSSIWADQAAVVILCHDRWVR